MSETLALLAICLPWLAALIAAGARNRAAIAASTAAWITGLAAVGAVALAVDLAQAGTLSVALMPPLVVLRLDGLALIMLVLVLGLSAIIQSFALRYLRADRRQAWFVASANALTGSTALMVCADTLFLFGAAWLASGLALLGMLATYAPEAQATQGVRAAGWRLALGDSALIIALIAVGASAGWSATFADLAAVAADLPPVLLAALALLLVLPALARSSQFPFHGWLPLTLAAPTPASALMHAGVVNAGAILIIRFTPLIGSSAVAMQLLFAAGAVTLVLAALLRMTKADTKGRLVYSTMAQMGFMIMTCGIGAAAAAVFHLVAHGLYKATLFLSAGSGIQHAARARLWPAHLPRSRGAAFVAVGVAGVLAAGAVLGSRLLVWPEISAASSALLLFVVAAAAITLAGTLSARMTWGTLLLGTALITGLAVTYSLGLRLLTDLLGDPALPPAAVSPWWVLLPGALLLMLQALAHRPVVTSRFHDALYARLLAVATPPLATQKGN